MMTHRLYIIAFLLIFIISQIHSVPAVDYSETGTGLTDRDLSVTNFHLRDNSMRPLNAADYITDSLILYGALWFNILFNYPVIGDRMSFIGNSGSTSFSDRVMLEPFANDKREVYLDILKDFDGNIVEDKNGHPVIFPNNLFFSRNVVEPALFYTYGLYLRSKNYHPALYIGIMFTLSFLHEFTVRPFFMEASFEQLIKNPAAGIISSIIFDEISTYLLTMPYMPAHVFAYILNPFKLLPAKKVRPLIFFQPYKKALSLEVIFEM